MKFLRPDLWWLFLLFLLSFATLIRLSYAAVTVPPRYKKILFGLRISVMAILLLVLLQPVLDSVNFKPVRPSMAVLTDSSLSMMVADPEAKGLFLKNSVDSVLDNVVRKWQNDYEISFFEFSDKIRPTRNLRDMKPADNQTDLKKSLLNFFSYFSENDYRALLIISDGQFPVDSGLSDAVKKYKDNRIAILPIINPDAPAVKDISVRFSKETVFELNTDQEGRILVDLKNMTTKPSQVRLELYDNSTLIKTKDIILTEGLKQEAFTYRTSIEGIHRLKIMAKTTADDSFKKNNEDHFFLRVNKGGFKVLLVYGEMSWEYKFLSLILKSDPTITLTGIPKIREDSFSILDKINIGLFDTVILGNTSIKDLKPSFLSELARRVKQSGLSLLVLGGERSFMSESGIEKNFASILPFETTGKLANITDPTPITLTREGESAAVTLLADNPSANKQAWERLPLLNHINSVEPKKNSSVLLVSAKNRNIPVLGYGTAGLGKVYYFTGYPTWKWSFMNLAVNDDHTKYQAFYRQLVREMTSSSLEKTRLATDKFLYEPGETARITAMLMDEQFKRPNFNSLEINLFKDGKKKTSLTLKNSAITKERFSGDIRLSEEGEYRLEAVVFNTKMETSFVVRGSVEEYFSIGPDLANMRRIAALSGTETLDPQKPFDMTKFADTKKRTKKFSLRLPLWNWFPVAAIIIILLTAEWILRKRKGLL